MSNFKKYFLMCCGILLQNSSAIMIGLTEILFLYENTSHATYNNSVLGLQPFHKKHHLQFFKLMYLTELF